MTHEQPRPLIVGSRGSRLALEQARRVRERMPGPSELRIIRTFGDRFTDKPLHEQEGVGFFTKEIEEELISGKIDLAVHSLKDLPTTLAKGLELAAVLKRDDPADVLLVSPSALDPERPLCLKPGAAVGASSLRRQAMLRALRPDLVMNSIRGNVPTRIDKARRGDCAAIVIARAGLARLALETAPLHAFDLNPSRWVCAPGQGAIAVEARAGDAPVVERVRQIDDGQTRACVEVERALLVCFGGGCHAPFGAWAESFAGGFRLFVGAPGADRVFRVRGFSAASLDQVRRDAELWIRSGCPAVCSSAAAITLGEPNGSEEWLCRPARPWC